MNEYVYEVTLRAVVRVRAADEEIARKVVPTVLGAPGTIEINWRMKIIRQWVEPPM